MILPGIHPEPISPKLVKYRLFDRLSEQPPQRLFRLWLEGVINERISSGLFKW